MCGYTLFYLLIQLPAYVFIFVLDSTATDVAAAKDYALWFLAALKILKAILGFYFFFGTKSFWNETNRIYPPWKSQRRVFICYRREDSSLAAGRIRGTMGD